MSKRTFRIIHKTFIQPAQPTNLWDISLPPRRSCIYFNASPQATKYTAGNTRTASSNSNSLLGPIAIECTQPPFHDLERTARRRNLFREKNIEEARQHQYGKQYEQLLMLRSAELAVPRIIWPSKREGMGRTEGTRGSPAPAHGMMSPPRVIDDISMISEETHSCCRVWTLVEFTPVARSHWFVVTMYRLDYTARGGKGED